MIKTFDNWLVEAASSSQAASQAEYGSALNDFYTGFGGIDFFLTGTKMSLPLHLRSLIDYIAKRETALTEHDLTQEERKFLYDTVCGPNKRTILRNGFSYPLWKSIGADNLPTAMSPAGSEKELDKTGSLFNPELPGVFMYTLGAINPNNIKINSDNSISVHDNYDMNSTDISFEDLSAQLVTAVKNKWNGTGTLYSIIRKIVSFNELFGYKGYPVNLNILSTGDPNSPKPQSILADIIKAATAAINPSEQPEQPAQPK